jgi:hypothetical protein
MFLVGMSDITADFFWRTTYPTFSGRQLPFNISVIPAFLVVYALEDVVASIESGTEGELKSLRRAQ